MPLHSIGVPGLVDQAIALDEVCPDCFGDTPPYPLVTPVTLNEDGVCARCGGKQYVPTEAGRAILDFIKMFTAPAEG